MSEIKYYNKQIFTENIQLDFKNLNTTNINLKIYNILKKKIENKCYKNGFIIKDRIQLINKNLGKFQNLESKNCIQYKIKFKVDILQPTIDDIIECYIDDINKLGIIAYIKYKDIIENQENNGINESPLFIIIPNENIDDVNKYNNHQKIKIIVRAIRIQFNANKIQIIGDIIE